VIIIHVFVHVKGDAVDDFRAASLENARNSVREPGVARFDIMQQNDDPARFVLVEVYRSPEAPGLHKETSHYKAWREAVEPMMAEPRYSIRYTNIFPDDAGW
jgi:quinol monooxygenase YgiN